MKIEIWQALAVMGTGAALIVACGGGERGSTLSVGPTAVAAADAPASPVASSLPAPQSSEVASLPEATQVPGMQKVKHVFVITLENKNYDDTFGTSTQDPYLTKTLRPMGALLTQYHGTGHASLDNYISMISGQPSSEATQGDCTTYAEFVQTGTTADGIPIGDGCVYPAGVKTLPDQLKARRLTWKGYMEDMGNDPTRESATCGHPRLGAADLTNVPMAPSAAVPRGDQYATRHNPFVYFHSIIDSPDCDANVIALDRLEGDLAQVATTANFSFITPQVCSDGHDGDGTGAKGKGCVDGKPGGLATADDFLKTWVPRILASPAYRQDGLLIVNFDESNIYQTLSSKDATSGKSVVEVTFKGDTCCNQPVGPNVTRPVTRGIPISATTEYRLVMQGHGGDRTGAVLLSPFIKPGTVSDVPYNHYSMLKSLENIFQVDGYLGYANQKGLVAFGTDIFVP